jgi:hypothetical protein
MIRYTCQACGKSLRAKNDIIGRKAPCTRCGAIAKVPATSTRPSSQHKKATKTGSLPESNESGPLLDSHVDVTVEEKAPAELSIVLPKQVSNLKEPSNGVDQAAESVDEFEPVFKRVEQKNNLASPLILFLAAGVLALSAYSFWSFNFGQAEDEKIVTAFEQTVEAIQYQAALFELRKSQRVLLVMADGYLAAKNLPESELGDLIEFVSSLDQFTNENIAIDEANDLFDAGHRDAATDLIEKETAILADFQAEVRRRTKELQSKTYQ